VNLGPPELLVILIIVLVLFGGAKLPKLARSLGQAQREFKDGLKDDDDNNNKRARRLRLGARAANRLGTLCGTNAFKPLTKLTGLRLVGCRD